MRIKIYKNEEELDFVNSLLIEEFINNEQLINEFEPIPIDFSDIHYLLNEPNKMMLDKSFQDELKETR